MTRRHLPEAWLFTDDRMGDALWRALERLPRGSGVIFRHYGAADRPALARRMGAVAKRRGLLLVMAGADKAGNIHLGRAARKHRGGRLITAAAHNRAEIVAARRAGAKLIFLSPVFATQSHPGGRSLGAVRFGLLARDAKVGIAALGGMTMHRYRSLRALGAVAWGAIDAWL